MNNETSPPPDSRALSNIRGDFRTSGRVAEYKQEYETVLDKLKHALNELCFEFFPPGATVEDIDRLTADVYERIITLWDRYNPEGKVPCSRCGSLADRK